MKVFLFIIFTISILIAPRINGVQEEKNRILFESLWTGILQTESLNLHFWSWKIVKSEKGAIGISQVMPETFRCIIKWSGRKDLKPSDIYIKKHNLWAGKWYFSNSYFYTYRANHYHAVSSYFRGTNSKKIEWEYVNKVLKNKGQWQWWKGLDKEIK